SLLCRPLYKAPSSTHTHTFIKNLVFHFPRLQLPALPPRWSETRTVLCDALDNFLSLASSLDGPCRIPLLSLYAVSRQRECLLPLVQVRGNFARLHSCVEELRSIPSEGCIRGAAAGADLLRQAVLDSLQQFKQYIRHTSAGSQVTLVTSQPGRSIVHQLEMGLKDADLVSLKRLLVVQIYSTGDWGQDTLSPEAAIYFELNDDLALSFHCFQECIREVKEWLLANSLILNDKKTEIVVFGSNVPRGQLRDAFGSLTSSLSDTVSNLGVLLDSSFKLDKQVSAVVRSSFYQLRLISKAKQYVLHKDLEKLIHAFVTSRLDYCNSLCFVLPSALLHRLQTVQNAAARILTRTGKFACITPVLADLHWLLIKYRIQFKILLLTFKMSNNTAPSHLKELLKSYVPARALRSSTQLLF
uniref:Meiosis 1 associated protein n=1 Tax=Pundamilia nyererei TaxID=303518 RepID=A0A3B4GUP3_9CICH